MRSAACFDSSPGKEARQPMEFGSTWGDGEIFKWYYTKLPRRTMNRLQIRITTTGAVPHRFVVAFMNDDPICRFDRRPLNTNGATLLVETATTPSRRAADEAAVVNTTEYAEIRLTSRVEVDVALPQETDIDMVLSACYAIAQDEKASIYALREYNCYFFAWSIVMIVMRHTLPFEIPPPADVRTRLESRLQDVTTALTNKIVGALLKIVLDTITTFRTETGRSLYPGLSKRELAVWGLPIPVVRALLHQCLKLRLHFGLRQKLEDQVRSQLLGRTDEVLQQVLSNQDVIGTDIQNRLWLFDLNEVFNSPVKNKILDILWDSLLDALSEGYGDFTQEEFEQEIGQLPLLHRLKYRFFGKNVMQFSQLWNEALHAALPAARAAGHGQYTPGTSHERMFELAFSAGCAAALQAAKAVVQRTSPILNNPKRDRMWEKVWSVWDKVWDVTRSNAETMVVDLINSTMNEIVAWVSQDVVKEIGNREVQKITASINFKKKKSSRELSLGSFQQWIRDFILSVPAQTTAHQLNIETAMAQAWDISRTTYQPLPRDAPHFAEGIEGDPIASEGQEINQSTPGTAVGVAKLRNKIRFLS
ncbi:hypothetical protein FS749_000382 [Ceratobasidium sp. UAMH 11750]|nr:hypothetical protein FS749_000382 [Ceratobasidium sp. UAMH 11750]